MKVVSLNVLECIPDDQLLDIGRTSVCNGVKYFYPQYMVVRHLWPLFFPSPQKQNTNMNQKSALRCVFDPLAEEGPLPPGTGARHMHLHLECLAANPCPCDKPKPTNQYLVGALRKRDPSQAGEEGT